MRITNISVTIESETVTNSAFASSTSDSAIVCWSCHLTGDFKPFPNGDPQEFLHNVTGSTPDEAWANMLHDLEASGVEL